MNKPDSEDQNRPPQSETPIEQRKYARLPLFLPGCLKLSQREFRVWIRDISLKGALVEQLPNQNDTTPTFNPHKNHSGQLVITADPEGITLLELEVQILRNQSGMIGLTWPTIDLDNLTQLREILMANLANEALIERDFFNLFHPT